MGYNLDIKAIADTLDFDIEDVEMLLEAFLESSQQTLIEMKNAIDQNDLESIFSSAHAIKGISANLTLNNISEIAKDLEFNAREGNEMDYISGYEKLKSLIEAIKE